MQLQTYILYPEIAKFSLEPQKNQYKIFKFFTFVPMFCSYILRDSLENALPYSKITCSKITAVTIPKNVTYIEYGAFKCLKKLRNLTI